MLTKEKLIVKNKEGYKVSILTGDINIVQDGGENVTRCIRILS